MPSGRVQRPAVPGICDSTNSTSISSCNREAGCSTFCHSTHVMEVKHVNHIKRHTVLLQSEQKQPAAQHAYYCRFLACFDLDFTDGSICTLFADVADFKVLLPFAKAAALTYALLYTAGSKSSGMLSSKGTRRLVRMMSRVVSNTRAKDMPRTPPSPACKGRGSRKSMNASCFFGTTDISWNNE